MAVRTEDGWTGIHSVWSTAVKDDPIWKYVLQGGVFSMENRSVPDAAHYIHLGITSIDTADLPVSVEVRIDTSPDAHLAGGGLVYRFDSRHQEYLAYIILSGQRLALFCRTQKMGYEAIYSGRCNLIREGDFNKLGMVGVGSHIHLYVGDQLLRKVHCREKLSNEVGIISCGKGRFEFDNFGIYDTALG